MDEGSFTHLDDELAGWKDPVGRMRQALKDNAFELYCQPVRALQGEERYPMAEVLIRMQEEERALLPPGQFLPVFEHYRMMPELDRWVVRRVVQRLAHGSKIPRYSVNLSRQTLEDSEFPDFVAHELTSAGVAASALLFEIDEIDLLAKPEDAQKFASSAKSIGIGLMIDGFGRKSVSFQRVREMGIDFLKVDGSITRQTSYSEPAQTKMNAILRMGLSAGVGVVAECVEDEGVLVYLKFLRVGYAQGFGISAPQPLASMAR